VRRKAVLCIASFIDKTHELGPQLSVVVRGVLADKDPGVVWAGLEAMHLLVKVHCSIFFNAYWLYL